jgi:MFS family permease
MLSGGSLTLIGTIIQTAAQNSSMFIASRFIIGFGISFTCVSGPSLLLELSRPEIRGTIASMV